MGKITDRAGDAVPVIGPVSGPVSSVVPGTDHRARGTAGPAAAKARGRGFSPRRTLQMLLVSTQLGSGRARAALTLLLFLAIWLLLSIPDAFAASLTRKSAFTYSAADGLLLTETVEPDLEEYGVKTTYQYDVYGNKTSATTEDIDTDNSKGALVNIEARTTTAAYATDIEPGVPNYGRFATSTTNALGHTETAVTDVKFGVTKSQTGPNGLTTTWQYDSMGRPTLEILTCH
jgi:hypothetical protein